MAQDCQQHQQQHHQQQPSQHEQPLEAIGLSHREPQVMRPPSGSLTFSEGSGSGAGWSGLGGAAAQMWRGGQAEGLPAAAAAGVGSRGGGLKGRDATHSTWAAEQTYSEGELVQATLAACQGVDSAVLVYREDVGGFAVVEGLPLRVPHHFRQMMLRLSESGAHYRRLYEFVASSDRTTAASAGGSVRAPTFHAVRMALKTALDSELKRYNSFVVSLSGQASTFQIPWERPQGLHGRFPSHSPAVDQAPLSEVATSAEGFPGTAAPTLDAGLDGRNLASLRSGDSGVGLANGSGVSNTPRHGSLSATAPSDDRHHGTAAQAHGDHNFAMEQQWKQHQVQHAGVARHAGSGQSVPGLASHRIHLGSGWDVPHRQSFLQHSHVPPGPAKGSGSTGSSSGTSRSLSGNTLYVSFSRLGLSMTHWQASLRYLYTLVEDVRSLSSAGLLDRLEVATHCGDPLLLRASLLLLRMSVRPLLHSCMRWMLSGEVTLGDADFFVVLDSRAAPQDMWERGSRLEEGGVPLRILSPRLARDVYRTGKSVHFLRHGCGSAYADRGAGMRLAQAAAREVEEEDRQRLARRDQERQGRQHERTMGTGSESVRDAVASVAAVATRVSARVESHLLQVMFERFCVLRHCQLVKDYVLLARGDFAECLLDGVAAELNRSARKVSLVELSGKLFRAVLCTHPSKEDRAHLERLHVHMSEPQSQSLPGSTASVRGWDVFSVRYVVDPPLSAVITPHCQATYTRIFHFLWTLRRDARLLSASFSILNEVRKRLSKAGGSRRRRRSSVGSEGSSGSDGGGARGSGASRASAESGGGGSSRLTASRRSSSVGSSNGRSSGGGGGNSGRAAVVSGSAAGGGGGVEGDASFSRSMSLYGVGGAPSGRGKNDPAAASAAAPSPLTSSVSGDSGNDVSLLASAWVRQGAGGGGTEAGAAATTGTGSAGGGSAGAGTTRGALSTRLRPSSSELVKAAAKDAADRRDEAGVYRLLDKAAMAEAARERAFAAALKLAELLGHWLRQVLCAVAAYFQKSVVGCCWAQFIERAQAASHLDDVVDSQRAFVDAVALHCFITPAAPDSAAPMRAALRKAMDVLGEFNIAVVSLQELEQQRQEGQQQQQQARGGGAVLASTRRGGGAGEERHGKAAASAMKPVGKGLASGSSGASALKVAGSSSIRRTTDPWYATADAMDGDGGTSGVAKVVDVLEKLRIKAELNVAALILRLRHHRSKSLQVVHHVHHDHQLLHKHQYHHHQPQLQQGVHRFVPSNDDSSRRDGFSVALIHLDMLISLLEHTLPKDQREKLLRHG